MAVRKTARTGPLESAMATGDAVEQQVVAVAEQLGGFLGTVRAKADGWLDRDALLTEVGRIRDGAAALWDEVNRAGASPLAAQKPTVVPTPRASRGAVDAPGKRHRKPPPQVRLDKRMGEPVGKKMGQKSLKGRIRSGRG
jgi:hypothetical protein